MTHWLVILAPYIVAIISAVVVYLKLGADRKADHLKAIADAETARQKKAEEDRFKAEELQDSARALAESYVRETMREQIAEIKELRAKEKSNRTRIGELEEENRELHRQLADVQGEVRQMKQIMASAARLSAAPE